MCLCPINEMDVIYGRVDDKRQALLWLEVLCPDQRFLRDRNALPLHAPKPLLARLLGKTSVTQRSHSFAGLLQAPCPPLFEGHTKRASQAGRINDIETGGACSSLFSSASAPCGRTNNTCSIMCWKTTDIRCVP